MQQASCRPFTGLAILLGLPHTASWTGGEQRETFHSVCAVFNKADLHCFTSKPFSDFCPPLYPSLAGEQAKQFLCSTGFMEYIEQLNFTLLSVGLASIITVRELQ